MLKKWVSLILLLVLATCITLFRSLVNSNLELAADSSNIWHPKPGNTWYWQLKETVDTSLDAEVYDIDRRALPAPDTSKLELSTAYDAPRTPVEQKLADIWAEVLSLQQVGMYDNFFELGGHSMLATQIIYRVCKAFQVELSVHTSLQRPLWWVCPKLSTLYSKQILSRNLKRPCQTSWLFHSLNYS